MSPFDYSKSITQSKEDLSGDEYSFEKEYVPFVVNRILSMSPQTALFAGAINQMPLLSKQMQYKFYMVGIPKGTKYAKYLKKDGVEFNQDHINFISEYMQVNMSRAIEIYSLIGPEPVQKMIESRGG